MRWISSVDLTVRVARAERPVFHHWPGVMLDVSGSVVLSWMYVNRPPVYHLLLTSTEANDTFFSRNRKSFFRDDRDSSLRRLRSLGQAPPGSE
jgi:hypothetical protein